jgi:hypothetical protein
MHGDLRWGSAATPLSVVLIPDTLAQQDIRKMPNISPGLQVLLPLEMTGVPWQISGLNRKASKLERQDRAGCKINRPDCKRGFLEGEKRNRHR